MRVLMVIFALFVIVGAVHAQEVVFSEDFQGDELASYWQLYQDDDSSVGVIDDPTDPESGNKVLMVDTWDMGGSAYAEVLASAFEGIDDSQQVTASFKFCLDDPDARGFTIMGTNFTSLADYYDEENDTTWYSAGGEGAYPFSISAYEWINFKFVFTPGENAGVTTHSVYIDDELMGTFDNVSASPGEGIAFFLGDKEEDGYTWGLAYWDDIEVEACLRADSETPEPASVASLFCGAAGLGAAAIRRRRLGCKA